MFEISPELLDSSDTRVRCGECFGIFDALANLLGPDDSGTTAAAEASVVGEGAFGGEAGERAADAASDVLSRPVEDADDYAADDALDVTYSDFDLFSGDAQLPEVAYLDETADTASFELDAVADRDPEDPDPGLARELPDGGAGVPDTGGDPAQGSGMKPFGSGTIGAPETDTAPSSPAEGAASGERHLSAGTPSRPETAPARSGADESVPEADGGSVPEAPSPVIAPSAAGPAAVLDDPPARPPARGGSWALRAVMVLALLSLLVGLYLHRERARLHNDPLGRPLLTLACKISGCEVPSRVDLAALTLLGKEVFTHPRIEGALVVNIAFRNTAPFPQRYPVMIVRLRDRVGRTVAEFDFPPSDYLDGWSRGDTLAAGRRLDITLEVDDPGDGAESYEFEFREADA